MFTFHEDGDHSWQQGNPSGDYLDEHRVRFATGQRERCPTTGNLHIQGYIEFNTVKRRTGVQGCLARGGPDPQRISCAPAREEAGPCIQYVRKSATRVDPEFSFVWQRGTQGDDMVEAAFNGGTNQESDIRRARGQGRRRDLAELASALRSGYESGSRPEALRVAWGENAGTVMKYANGVNKYIEYLESLNARVIRVKQVIVRWGETGTGKTESVFTQFPDLWRSLPTNRGEKLWFQGYTGQRVALFDDYDGSAIPICTLLQLTDRYPMTVEYKGGSTPWCPEIIIFTSNKAPADWYTDQTPEHRNALYRRITQVYWYRLSGVEEQPEYCWKPTH